MINFGNLEMERYFEIRNYATLCGYDFKITWQHDLKSFIFTSTKTVETIMWLKYGK